MLKRFCDIGLSAIALFVLAPLLSLLSVCIVLDSGFPVLFSQLRVGRGFRQFRVWKFRTMRTGLRGPSITISGDPRVTSFGKLLRALKLDELPQLWNVLVGDMSLVGPRPELPEYVLQFKDRYERLLKIRPGITDTASICFHNEEELLAASTNPSREYVDHVLPLKLDLADNYLRAACFSKDLSILLQTASTLFRKLRIHVTDRLPSSR